MLRPLLLCCLFLAALPADAAEIRVAVAANFAGPLETLAERYREETGDRLIVSIGSTGKHYAQIRQGAPFEVFLAADAERPARLEREGRTLPGSRFTYAQGQLVLWSPSLPNPLVALQTGDFRFLALANPRLAPYGQAAQEVLDALALDIPGPQRVRGENIGQTYQFVRSGAAELGFVALSQVIDAEGRIAGHYWLPPASLYAPIDQQAVLLAGAGEPAARFANWLRTDPTARAIIAAAGYRLPE